VRNGVVARQVQEPWQKSRKTATTWGCNSAYYQVNEEQIFQCKALQGRGSGRSFRMICVGQQWLDQRVGGGRRMKHAISWQWQATDRVVWAKAWSIWSTWSLCRCHASCVLLTHCQSLRHIRELAASQPRDTAWTFLGLDAALALWLAQVLTLIRTGTGCNLKPATW